MSITNLKTTHFIIEQGRDSVSHEAGDMRDRSVLSSSSFSLQQVHCSPHGHTCLNLLPSVSHGGVVPFRHRRAEDGPSHRTAGRTRTLGSTSAPFVFPVVFHSAGSPEERGPAGPVSSALWSPSCWDRREPRKGQTDWVLIPVRVPEMSAGRSQVPVRFPRSLCSLCPAAAPSSHCPGGRCGSLGTRTDSGNVPSWGRERTRCGLLWKSRESVWSRDSSSFKDSRVRSVLTRAQLKRKSGKRLCLASDSRVHFQFNAWSRKRPILLWGPKLRVLVHWTGTSQEDTRDTKSNVRGHEILTVHIRADSNCLPSSGRIASHTHLKLPWKNVASDVFILELRTRWWMSLVRSSAQGQNLSVLTCFDLVTYDTQRTGGYAAANG